MQRDDLSLFTWSPPVAIIPFPTSNRVGHARRIAEQLSKARSNREADHVLTRSVIALCRQMRHAGIPADEVELQRLEYLKLIDSQCRRLNARWMPDIPTQSESIGPGGAA
jgi:hypothetical protein